MFLQDPEQSEIQGPLKTKIILFSFTFDAIYGSCDFAWAKIFPKLVMRQMPARTLEMIDITSKT